MTAYLAIVQADAAYLVSDGAAVDQSGRLAFVVSKPTLFPHLGLAVAVTGAVHPDCVLEDMNAAAPADQQEALKSLPAVAHSIAGRNRTAAVPSPDVVLVAITWHPVGGPAAWTCATGASAARRGWKPWQVHRVRAVLEDIADPASVLGRPVDLFDPGSFDPATDGITLMEDCRSRPADAAMWGGRTDHYGIGGHVDLVTADSNGVSRRLLKTWPEDRVGHRIAPHQIRKAA